MEFENLLYLLGPLIGFGVFLTGTLTMNGIYFRPNSEGDRVFTIHSLKEFIISPFQYGTHKFNILWGIVSDPDIDWKSRLKMLQLNWIAMVGLGTLFSIGIFML
jgi:hypothetical protein